MINQIHKSYCCRLASRIAALLMLAIAISVVPNRSAASPGGSSMPQFCQEHLSRYLQPLLRMPPVQSPPSSERLPFGPQSLRFFIPDELQVGPGGFGFSFVNNSYRPFRSDWLIEAELLRVDPAGRVTGKVAHKVDYLSKIAPNSARQEYFHTSGQPAYYRIDLSVKTRGNGKVLGRYGAYFRVVPPTFGVKLAASSKDIALGETIYSRIRNLGTELVTPDSVLSIEQQTGEQWVPVGSVLVSGHSRNSRARLWGGEDTSCASVQITEDMEPGTYRFKANIRSSFHEHKREVARFAEFSVGS